LAGDGGCGDPRWWLWGQLELELLDQQPQFWLWLGVTNEQQFPPVGGRQMNVDHLDRGELLESAARGQSWCQCMQATLQRDLQTIGRERNEDVGFDPALFLMEDWPYRQVAFQIFERLFHGNELGIVLPQQSGIVLREVGPQQIAPFPSPDPPQLLAVEGVGEPGAFLAHLDINQAPRGGSAGPCRAQLHQHLFTRDFHRGEFS